MDELFNFKFSKTLLTYAYFTCNNLLDVAMSVCGH